MENSEYPISPRRSVVLALFLLHFFGGMVAAFFATDWATISTAIFIAVIFCQTSLLGMWGGLGATHWILRLLGLALGTIYLAFELGWGIDEMGPQIFLLVIIATSVVAVVTWMVRLVKVAIIRRVEVIPDHSNERLQFSIRQLMIFTFVVACFLSVGKFLAPFVPGLDTMAQVSALALCFAAVALTAIWAILGFGHPAFRSIFVVAIAVTAGVVNSYVLDALEDIVFWILTTVLQACFLLGSLWIMRRGNYRIAAKIQPAEDVAS